MTPISFLLPQVIKLPLGLRVRHVGNMDGKAYYSVSREGYKGTHGLRSIGGRGLLGTLKAIEEAYALLYIPD